MNNKFFIKVIVIFVFIIIISLFLFYKPTDNWANVCFNNFCFEVEIAKTPAELAKGLMFRKNLDQNEGMLFVFEKEENHPFWMKGTLIPLDIIWINKDGRVVFINENSQPCLASRDLAEPDQICPQIIPQAKAKYVLEINAGLCQKIGLQVGDSVVINL